MIPYASFPNFSWTLLYDVIIKMTRVKTKLCQTLCWPLRISRHHLSSPGAAQQYSLYHPRGTKHDQELRYLILLCWWYGWQRTIPICQCWNVWILKLKKLTHEERSRLGRVNRWAYTSDLWNKFWNVQKDSREMVPAMSFHTKSIVQCTWKLRLHDTF